MTAMKAMKAMKAVKTIRVAAFPCADRLRMRNVVVPEPAQKKLKQKDFSIYILGTQL